MTRFHDGIVRRILRSNRSRKSIKFFQFSRFPRIITCTWSFSTRSSISRNQASCIRDLYYFMRRLTRFDVAACKLLEEGVAAIFGPSSPYTYGIVASIAARFDVPHIDYFWRQNEELQADQEPKNPKPMTINFFPDSEMVGQVSRSEAIFTKIFKNQADPVSS